jgi:hypothetical protein
MCGVFPSRGPVTLRNSWIFKKATHLTCDDQGKFGRKIYYTFNEASAQTSEASTVQLSLTGSKAEETRKKTKPCTSPTSVREKKKNDLKVT